MCLQSNTVVLLLTELVSQLLVDNVMLVYFSRISVFDIHVDFYFTGSSELCVVHYNHSVRDVLTMHFSYSSKVFMATLKTMELVAWCFWPSQPLGIGVNNNNNNNN